MITEYLNEVNRSMVYLSEHPKIIFVGQAINYPGTAVTRQLENIPIEKKLEFPVAEDLQAGFCLGLALDGYIPICIYPRFNFALLAVNQIVNHIDKWILMTHDRSNFTKIIFKIVIGSDVPLDPGHQHKADYTIPFKQMCDYIEVVELSNAEDVFPAYKKALDRDSTRSTILVEHSYKYAYESLVEK